MASYLQAKPRIFVSNELYTLYYLLPSFNIRQQTTSDNIIPWFHVGDARITFTSFLSLHLPEHQSHFLASWLRSFLLLQAPIPPVDFLCDHSSVSRGLASHLPSNFFSRWQEDRWLFLKHCFHRVIVPTHWCWLLTVRRYELLGTAFETLHKQSPAQTHKSTVCLCLGLHPLRRGLCAN